MEQPIAVATISTLEDNKPQYALVKGLDLVIIRYGEEISVLYGRCLHREAMMADGPIAGRNIVYGVHGWDYRYDTGVSDSTNKGKHHEFSAWAKEDTLYGVGREIERFLAEHPQPFDREFYLGNCLGATNQFIKVIARSFGYDEMAKFQPRTYPPTVMKCIGIPVLPLRETDPYQWKIFEKCQGNGKMKVREHLGTEPLAPKCMVSAANYHLKPMHHRT